MTKKAVKKIVKKKQPTKKKGLRKHLTQNTTQQEQSNVSNVQTLRQVSTSSPNGNNLRSSLMANMGMTPLLGMGAQQYGNINNEKNIRDAQMRCQTLTK